MGDRELEVLVEQGVGVVAVDRRLAFPAVDLGDEGEADVGVVEAALVAARQVVGWERDGVKLFAFFKICS